MTIKFTFGLRLSSIFCRCVFRQTRRNYLSLSSRKHASHLSVSGIVNVPNCRSFGDESPARDHLKVNRGSQSHQDHHYHGLMSAWQIYNYGENNELSFSNTCHIPTIHSPNDVLIKVQATSVNPIDVKMRAGFGRAVINGLRLINSCQLGKSEFPLILGRDFSGTVVDTGQSVTKFKPDEEVWGALSPNRPGSHAQYTVAGENEISRKPACLTHPEAASVPYGALTIWAAIRAHDRQKWCRGKRFLITAGSGGVGTFAIQLLKAWGGHVTTTCSSDAVSLCGDLGADEIVDYTCPDSLDQLRRCDKFDFILDLVGSIPSHVAASLLRPGNNSKYVTLTSPLLGNADDLGLALGTIKSSLQFGADFFQTLRSGSRYSWAFFSSDGAALSAISHLYENKQMRPVVEEVVPFDELPAAYRKVEEGHTRGKIIIDHSRL